MKGLVHYMSDKAFRCLIICLFAPIIFAFDILFWLFLCTLGSLGIVMFMFPYFVIIAFGKFIFYGKTNSEELGMVLYILFGMFYFTYIRWLIFYRTGEYEHFIGIDAAKYREEELYKKAKIKSIFFDYFD